MAGGVSVRLRKGREDEEEEGFTVRRTGTCEGVMGMLEGDGVVALGLGGAMGVAAAASAAFLLEIFVIIAVLYCLVSEGQQPGTRFFILIVIFLCWGICCFLLIQSLKGTPWFWFVQYSDPHDAAEATHHMDGQSLLGRELTVVFVEENRKKPAEMRAREGVSGGQHRGRRWSPPRYSCSPPPHHLHVMQGLVHKVMIIIPHCPNEDVSQDDRSVSPQERRHSQERSQSLPTSCSQTPSGGPKPKQKQKPRSRQELEWQPKEKQKPQAKSRCVS